MQDKRILLHLTPKLTKQEMDDVFVEFYRLGEILGKNDQHTQNYIVIRLVTIVEQFFRKIVEKQIENVKGGIPHEITINTNYLSNIKSTSKERLISSSYSFQNVDNITRIMKNFQIPKVFSWKKEDHQDEFKELFRLRHDTVHTVMPLKEDITNYHKITEDMMMHVLDKTYNGDEYFYVSKGHAFFTLERYDDATQCYDYLISIRPDHRNAHANKGFSLAALGRYAEMLGCFEKAIGLIPNLAIAYVGKGLALTELGRYDEALGCFEQAPALGNDDALGFYYKGVALAELGRYDEALECFEKTIILKPDFGGVYASKGTVFEKLERHGDALECFEKALVLGLDPASMMHYSGDHKFVQNNAAFLLANLSMSKVNLAVL